MLLNRAPSWQALMNDELSKDYFKKLTSFVSSEYRNHQCFPEKSAIFSAFEHCSVAQTKVVILGQDPYHGEGQADGLCFSVRDQVPMPPSLKNIFKEIEADLGQPFPETGNLERWAQQGVLLLNASLTVRAHQAGSHQRKGWEKFTDAVIANLSTEKQNLVFMLWGGYAKRKGKIINRDNHLVLQSGHPSPLSANRGYWFGNNHFSKANAYLTAQGKSPIVW